MTERIENKMLYFICGKCYTEFKVDKSFTECVQSGNTVRYYTRCPVCWTECAGMSRSQYLSKDK